MSTPADTARAREITPDDKFRERIARAIFDSFCPGLRYTAVDRTQYLEAADDVISTLHKIGTLNALTARARAEDRERAAGIAERRIVGGYLHGSPEWADGPEIAAAIRQAPEAGR